MNLIKLFITFFIFILFSFGTITSINAVCSVQQFSYTSNTPGIGYQAYITINACCVEGDTTCDLIFGGDPTCDGYECTDIPDQY